MDNQEIIENNKLIARFMGEEFFIDNVYDVMDEIIGNEPKVKFKEMLRGQNWSVYSNAHKKNELCYHLHWEWLMPVVKKVLDSFIGDVNNWTFKYERRIKEALVEVNIEKVYESVAEYINYISNLVEVIINEDGAFAKEINPLGNEPDEDDFDKYPLPICFDPEDEKRELWKRKKMIEDKWREADEKLRTFQIENPINNSSGNYVLATILKNGKIKILNFGND